MRQVRDHMLAHLADPLTISQLVGWLEKRYRLSDER